MYAWSNDNETDIEPSQSELEMYEFSSSLSSSSSSLSSSSSPSLSTVKNMSISTNLDIDSSVEKRGDNIDIGETWEIVSSSGGGLIPDTNVIENTDLILTDLEVAGSAETLDLDSRAEGSQGSQGLGGDSDGLEILRDRGVRGPSVAGERERAAPSSHDAAVVT